jgi:peptidoglycan/LPS O-acetylase OafA/YrhL
MNPPVPLAAERAWLLEAFKGLGCLFIVLHHLAFYGPMADVVAQAWPAWVGWLNEHGRLAVQVFLVCGGFLTAQSLSKQANFSVSQLGSLVRKRYLRLAIPLLAALSLTVLVTELLRPIFDHDSLSPPPEFWQALAHVFFLQHLGGMDGLSAGVWYVAVDLQLYVSALLLMLMAQQAHALWPQWPLKAWLGMLWFVLVAGSLWWWNRHPELEDLNLYFLGAYGLGWLAHSVRHAKFQAQAIGVAAMLLLGAVAWWLEPRWRVATAWGVAICLACAPQAWWMGTGQTVSPWRQGMGWLSRISYSVFVVHFAVSLVVNAVVTHVWPAHVWVNALGMLASLMLSLVAGAWLYEKVEKPAATGRRWWVWTEVFIASALLAMLISGTL